MRKVPAIVFAKATTGGCLLSIIGAPGAAGTAVEGVDEWRRALRIRIQAEAERGRANEDLLKFLSLTLSLDVADIRIVRGAKSHRKIVFVPLAPEEAARLLGVG